MNKWCRRYYILPRWLQSNATMHCAKAHSYIMWLMTNAIKTWRNESKNEVRTEGMKVSVNSAHALLMTWSNPKAPSLSSANVQSSRLHLATHSTNSQNPIWSHTHKLADLSMSRPSQPFHFVGYSRVNYITQQDVRQHTHNHRSQYRYKTRYIWGTWIIGTYIFSRRPIHRATSSCEWIS